MSARSAPNVVVFSCDENYVPLARGLVLSLGEIGVPDADTDLVLIDIGCSAPSLDWMRERGVRVVSFDASLLPPAVLAAIGPQQRAQAIRPWIPDLLPDHAAYIWFDSDIWLQNGEVLDVLRRAVIDLPQNTLLAPGCSHYNFPFHADMQNFLSLQRTWSSASYGNTELAELLARRLHLSSGVFAMARSSPNWEAWKQEVTELYPRLAAVAPRLVHLAEQIALNAVLQRDGRCTRLDPLYNFHCNSGGALRHPGSGKVVTAMMRPLREIGVIHLANWSLMKRRYFEDRLLYAAGAYLRSDELERLAGLGPAKAAG